MSGSDTRLSYQGGGPGKELGASLTLGAASVGRLSLVPRHLSPRSFGGLVALVRGSGITAFAHAQLLRFFIEFFPKARFRSAAALLFRTCHAVECLFWFFVDDPYGKKEEDLCQRQEEGPQMP